MQSSPSLLKAAPATQSNLTLKTDFARVNTINASLLIALPVVLICAIVAYRKYRTMILQRRIQRLNQLWHLDSTSKRLS